MSGIVFRFMYENCVSGTILSGTVGDSQGGDLFDFKYVSGVSQCRGDYRPMQGKKRLLQRTRSLDYFFLGAYTIPAIAVLINEIRSGEVKTVILPYVPPIQRLTLISKYEKSKHILSEEIEFLADPELYLKGKGIMNRFFLYNNGEDLPNNYEEMDEALARLKEGVYLEECEKEDRDKVLGLEGHKVDLRKAGYIFDSGWFFYFSVYGLDLSQKLDMHVPDETIVLFTAPIRSRREDYYAKLFAVALNQQSCCNESLKRDIPGCVKCLHEHDHISFHTQTEEPVPHIVAGHFLLGNYNLNRDIGTMLSRYSGIREMIRVISIPSCGAGTHWNRVFPSLFAGDYSKYWFINVTERTDSSLMLDITNTSPRNRFFMGSSQISYCLTGIVNRKTNNACDY